MSEKIITIAPLISKQAEEGVIPAPTYWGIYLDGEQVSYTSSRELAEKTKKWMEKWFGPDGNPPLFL